MQIKLVDTTGFSCYNKEATSRSGGVDPGRWKLWVP